MNAPMSALPVDLGDGLLMRWATKADVEELAAFNARVHADGSEPDEALALWTRDLMDGRHPTVGPGDFTVIVDSNAEGRIVSSLMLISQTWTYAGIPFGVGRPELVGTLPEYRQRGLVRRQMEVIHALSASRGEMVQAITGIPWFYRQFGYEQTVNLGGARLLVWGLRGELKAPTVRLRPATTADIQTLTALYARQTSPYLLACQRDEAIWTYLLETSSSGSVNHRFYCLVEAEDGALLGYVGYYQAGHRLGVTELAAFEDVSLRDFCVGVAVALQTAPVDGPAGTDVAGGEERPARALRLSLGTDHPAYEVLGGLLERQDPPYTWYLRLPDLAGFLRHIGPVLERRLAASGLGETTTELKLNFYRSQLKLAFQDGHLVEVAPYQPADFFDGHIFFPDLTFLHVLFGHLTLEQLSGIRSDCFAAHAYKKPLLAALFPQVPSAVNALS